LRLKTEQALYRTQSEELTKLRAQANRIPALEADLAIERESSSRRKGLSFKEGLMKKPLKCKRRKIGSARFAVKMDVQVLGLTPEGEGFEGVGVVRNLSMRGALIETHTRMETDDHLTLFVTLPNETGLLEIPAVAVRWVVRPHQLGVEFLKLDTQTCRQLMRSLSRIHNATRA